MNADAIVKALKCCNVPSGRACSECPYHEVGAECRTKRNKKAVELILELIEESHKWQEAYYCADSACRELSSKCDELTEENERLRFISAHVCVGDVITSEQIEKQRMAHTLPGMHGDPVGPVGMVWVESYDEVRAETVRKMQERLKNYLREVADGEIGYGWIDQIAKEMLEENNVQVTD